MKSFQGRGRVIVVAGADELSQVSLERLSRRAMRSQTRLVLMFRHLRGAVSGVLGGDGSAAVFMRLGNAEQASAAASFIGHGHRFVFSQLTRTVGQTLTSTTGDTTTEQHGMTESETRGDNFGRTYGDGWLPNTTVGESRSYTFGESRSESWARTRSLAEAESKQSGETISRVYEFLVEPTHLQSLPTTAFVAVARDGSDDLIVAGDCNPGIALLDRVSPTPLRLAVRT
jgi:hypothetical protein